MKKNAVWQPSEVMIHRELALSGRGWEAYRVAKALAIETGTEFIDCDNLEETRHEEMVKDLEETKLSNRGMKLNEAKKLKRELLAREAAANGETPVKPIPSPVRATPASRSSRKRKRDEIAAEEAVEAEVEAEEEAIVESAPVSLPVKTSSSSKSSSTRRRSSRGAAAANGSTDATSAPIAPIAIQEPSAVETKASPPPPPSPTGSRRSTRSIVQPVATPTPPVTRPSSRRSAVASIELGNLGGLSTSATAGGRDFRIKSATPARKTPIREPSHAPSVPAPARRRKRPAPGPVSTGQDGGAAVSYGRRKAKPGKKRISTGKSQETRVDEDGVLEEIDSNEPRYCLCGDVSFGTMICCENQEVCLPFHSPKCCLCFLY